MKKRITWVARATRRVKLSYVLRAASYVFKLSQTDGLINKNYMSRIPPSNISSAPPDLNFDELRQEGLILVKPIPKRARSLISPSEEPPEVTFRSSCHPSSDGIIDRDIPSRMQVQQSAFIEDMERNSLDCVSHSRSNGNWAPNFVHIEIPHEIDGTVTSANSSLYSHRLNHSEKRRRLICASVDASPVRDVGALDSDSDSSSLVGFDLASCRIDESKSVEDFQIYYHNI